MKTYTVYEVLWTLCEYGGPSQSAQSTLHLTREEAIEYRKRREGLTPDPATAPEPFYYRGSEPQAKSVGKSEYRRLKASAADRLA